MTAKEYLSQYRYLDKQISAKLEHVSALRTMAEHITPVPGDGIHGETVADKVGETVAKIVDLENEINADIDRLVGIKADILRVINRVEDITLQTLLELRYINCETLEQVAVGMTYSYPQICRLHGRALNSVMLILIDTPPVI